MASPRRWDRSMKAWGRLMNVCLRVASAGVCIGGVSVLSTSVAAAASDATAVAWGADASGQTQVPALGDGVSFVQVSGGFNFSLGLLNNGQVIGWGDNTAGELNVPAPPSGLSYVAVSAGGRAGDVHTSSSSSNFSLGLLSNGTGVGWGDDSYAQIDVPSGTFSALAAGAEYGLGLTTSGDIVGWGLDRDGVTDPPAPPPGLAYVAVAAGYDAALGLLSNGTVVGWGDDTYGETNVPAPPPGQTYTAIAAGNSFSLGLLSGGSVVGWGYGGDGSTNAPAGTYTAISAGGYFALGLLSNGNIVGWGATYYGETTVPPLPTGWQYVAVATGFTHGLALMVPPNQAPAITSAASTTFAVGSAGGFTVTTTGYPVPSLTESGSLPAGVSFVDNGDGTATVSGTPAAGSGGTYPVSITASNGFSPNATQAFKITVDQTPAFTADSPPLAVLAGQPYGYNFGASGFPAPSYSLASGAASWLSINPSTGALSGTVPTDISSFSYGVVASNDVGSPAVAGPFTVSVTPVVTLSFTGSLTYANTGPITSGSLKVSPSTGTIGSVTGTLTIPGLNGGTARVSVVIVRLFDLYIGAVSVSDPSAHLDTTAIVFSKALTRTMNGEVTGTASGSSDRRVYTLVFTI
jgi:hypothetical protein